MLGTIPKSPKKKKKTGESGNQRKTTDNTDHTLARILGRVLETRGDSLLLILQ